ncbi:MAG: hypothetical protein IKC74_00875 [Clostridia bacterium]|nr:hypothetical protein [Clostridia bacterium]
MILKINIARSDLYSATASIDEIPLDKCDLDEGCSCYHRELKEGYHRVEIVVRRIIKGKGEGLLTGGLNIATGNIKSILEDSKMEKYCYDIKIEEGKDTLYINYDGKVLPSLTNAEIIHVTTLTRYEPEDYRGMIKFSGLFMIPLIFLVAAFCIYNGVSLILGATSVFKAVVMLIAGGLMALLGVVYLVKILILKSIIKKFKQSEDYYDKL